MQPQRQIPNIPTGAELPAPAESLSNSRGERQLGAVPGIEGPIAAPEAAPVAPIEKGQTSAPERKLGRVDNQPTAQPTQAQPVPVPPILQQVDPATQGQGMFGDDAAQGTGPATADDNDLIEKEWVSKAKDVVNNTKDDPFQQEKQVSKLQADYLKKRYNKDIKTAS